MKKGLKIIYKSFLTLGLGFICLLLATGLYIYNYQEQIIIKAFQAAKSQLSFPIQAKNIELHIFKNFPKLSLSLHDVVIQHPEQGLNNILTAHKVDCMLNLSDLLQGKYIIHELCVEQGTLSFYGSDQQKPTLDQSGFHNATANQKQSQLLLPITLKKLVLNEVKCSYIANKSQSYIFYAQSVQAESNAKIKNPNFDVVGKVVIEQIPLQTTVCKPNLPITVDTNISYDVAKQVYSLQHGTVKQQANKLRFQGSWSNRLSGPFTDLQIDVDQLTIVDSLRFLPIAYCKCLIDHQVQGKLVGKIQLVQQAKNPLSISTNFKVIEGGFLPKNFRKPIQLEYLTAKLCLPNIYRLNQGSLQIDEYRAKLGNSQLTGKAKLTDLEKLLLENHTNIVIDLPSLSQVFFLSTDTNLKGQLVGDFDLESSIYDLLQPAANQKLPRVVGEVIGHDIEFIHNQTLFQLPHPVTLVLDHDSLNFKDLAGEIEGKPFVLAAKFTNWIKFWLGLENKLYFDAKLYAEHIDLDTFLLANKPGNNTSVSGFYVPTYLAGELLCDIEEIAYRRFWGNKLRGKIKICNQEFIADGIELGIAGGKGYVTGSINASSDSLQIHTQTSLQNVELATLFHVFENFNQHFLEERHLGGKIWSDINLNMQTNRAFHIDKNSVIADVSIQLEKGTLRNFEPLQRLSAYVPEKELKCLYFSSLKNNIHIQNKTIYIPPMEIHSSVTSIQLSGTHTFDGEIDYNLVVPIQNATSQEIKLKIPEINEEALAGLNLYLKLAGNVKDYTLRYDHILFKSNLKESLKKQGKYLNEILQGKGSSKRSKELSTDEYFDFE
jgi:hypothetical protein